MVDNKQAILNGIATSSMYEMLRKGQTFKLPSVLANFIANDGWTAVEYLDPETEAKKVAKFDCFTDWVTGSPARGALGSQVHVIAEFITQPMDMESAPDCTVKLAKAEPALLPKLLKVAKANNQANIQGWSAVVNELTKLQGNAKPGPKPKPKSEPESEANNSLYTIQGSLKAPTGTSAAAGLRKLRRYASSEQVCATAGIDQAAAAEQYASAVSGAKSVHRALIDCGLRKKSTTSAGLGVDGPADDVARRIIKRLGKAGAAALANEITLQLSK